MSVASSTRSSDVSSDTDVSPTPFDSDPGPVLVTTTIFTVPSPTRSQAVSQASSTPSLPIGAIAGGTAGGIVLAVALVVAWTWWGRCLKRKAAKERAEHVAAVEVRENTRRNASLSLTPSRVSSSSLPRPEKRVTFASEPSPPSDESTTETIQVPSDPPSTDVSDTSTSASTITPQHTSINYSVPVPVPAVSKPPDIYGRAHKPVKSNPLSRSLQGPTIDPEPEPEPALSRFSQNLIFPIPRNREPPAPAPTPHVPHTLVHKGSTLSDGSVYSTQSAEEQYTRAPQSLIMAALNLRKQPSGGFMRAYRPANANNEQSRLSQISTGSGYSQIDYEDTVGYAA